MQKQSGHSRQPSNHFQRAYQACSACRSRKVKCNIDRRGSPCQRCRRQRKECLFDAERTVARGHRQKGSSGGGNALLDESQSRHDTSYTAPEEHGLLSEPLDESIGVSRRNARIQTNRALGGPSDHFTTPLVRTADIPPTAAHEHESMQIQVASYAPEHNSLHSTSGLATSVMRTLVTSGNDALNILFEAASRDVNTNNNAGDEYLRNQYPIPWGISPQSFSAHAEVQVSNPLPSLEAIKVWGECRFVMMGWVTALDALTYIDLFFKNMSDLSPVLTSYFASHDRHHELLAKEPMLCCTILMISTRYHVLPGLAGMSKSYFFHNRLWKYWQDLVNRVIFGQSKGIETNLRSLGTIESLLIMIDWHPRSLNFPPEGYGWNIDLLPNLPDAAPAVQEQLKSIDQWLEEVVEPTRRSDRMSWMLLGSALSLAHELGIFDNHTRRRETVPQGDYRHRQVNRVQKLLYVYIHQLASRLGCSPMMSHNLNLVVSGGNGQETLPGDPEWRWDFFMAAWIALTKLLKSISDIFFPSAASTREQLRSGRYIGLLDHFHPLLSQWREKFLDVFTRDTEEQYRSILFVEYQYIETLLNSFGIQAIVERNIADTQPETAFEDDRLISLEDMDLEYIQGVIRGSCKILEMVPDLARSGKLRFMPVRFYLRVTSASVLLLKALCLGVRKSQLKSSLDIIDRSNQALKSCTLDDMHLAPRYATLLDMHVSKLRGRFILSSKYGGEPRPRSPDWSSSTPNPYRSIAEQHDGIDSNLGPSFQDLSPDDWFFLPFDPSMAPFELSGDQAIPGFDEGTLNFAWSLPCL